MDSQASPIPQFKCVHSSVLSFFYSPTLTSIHDYLKTIALTRQTFVHKIMSLLFNMLSRFISFLLCVRHCRRDWALLGNMGTVEVCGHEMGTILRRTILMNPVPWLNTYMWFFRPDHVCMLSRFSHVWLPATLWTVACHAPLSMGFSKQEYWSGLPCPPPGDLPDRKIEPG